LDACGHNFFYHIHTDSLIALIAHNIYCYNISI